MKIAYAVLAHTDPSHVVRLARKLVSATNNEVFIHVDLKSDLQPFVALAGDTRRIHFLQNRVPVWWAGFNSVVATVDAFSCALDSGSFDRFVILQGLDYPIVNNDVIDEFFGQHPDTEFIRGVNESISTDFTDLHKYCLRWQMDYPSRAKQVTNGVNSLLVRSPVVPPLKKPYVSINGRKSPIYRGWAHFALTRSATEFVANFYRSHPKFNDFFRTVYAPDESYFHTILHNSRFAANIPSADSRAISDMLNLTYFEYPLGGVRVFRKIDEYSVLRDSGLLYFRKATSDSSELLDYIDREHESQVRKGDSPRLPEKRERSGH